MKDAEIEVHTYKSFVRDVRIQEARDADRNKDNIIKPPPLNNPDAEHYFGNIGMI